MGERSQLSTQCETWPGGSTDLEFQGEYLDPCYIPVWNNPRVLSFKTYANTAPYYYRNYQRYDTYFLEDGAPVKKQLSDLFTGDQWRTVITNALLARLDSQPSIHADCADRKSTRLNSSHTD